MCAGRHVHAHATPSTHTLLPSSSPISKELSSPSTPHQVEERMQAPLLSFPQSVLLERGLCKQDFVPMSLESNWSRMQSRISGVLMCEFVWKRQRGGGDAVLCTQLSGAGIHARLRAPCVPGATPVPGSWYTFPCDFRQPSFRPHSHSGEAALPPPTSISPRGASPS